MSGFFWVLGLGSRHLLAQQVSQRDAPPVGGFRVLVFIKVWRLRFAFVGGTPLTVTLGFHNMGNKWMKRIKAAMLLGALVISGVVSADLNTGLVAYWSFNDCTAKDNNGSNIIGTLNNVTCVDGIKSKAFSFNGSNSSITTILPTVKKTYSVSMFTKFNKNNYNQLFYLGRNTSYPDRLGFLMTYYPAGGNSWHWGSMDMAGTLWNNPSHWGDRAGLVEDPKGLLSDNWYHIVFVLNDTDISLYVDGVLLKVVKSSYHSSIENYPNLLFMLGMEVEGHPMNGLIDETRIYNRALTNAEVTALYHQGVKPTKNGVSSNTDQCINNVNWCVHPTFTVFGVTKDSDIPINLINTSYIVDGFNRNISSGKVNITANLYNRGYADAMLDIYDKQGNWTGFIRLDGNRPETSVVGDIWDKWTTTYDSYNDEYSTFDPRDAGSSKKLNVAFLIPQGGYARLSKNSTTAIANTLINSTLDIIGAGDYFPKEGGVRKKIIKLFDEEIAKSSINLLIGQLTNAIDRNNDTDARYIFTELTKESLSVAFRVFVTEGDARTRLIQIMGGNEKRYTKLFGKKVAQFISKAGGLVSIAEGVATSLGLAGQWIDIAKANNDKAVYFK